MLVIRIEAAKMFRSKASGCDAMVSREIWLDHVISQVTPGRFLPSICYWRCMKQRLIKCDETFVAATLLYSLYDGLVV